MNGKNAKKASKLYILDFDSKECFQYLVSSVWQWSKLHPLKKSLNLLFSSWIDPLVTVESLSYILRGLADNKCWMYHVYAYINNWFVFTDNTVSESSFTAGEKLCEVVKVRPLCLLYIYLCGSFLWALLIDMMNMLPTYDNRAFTP